MLKVHWLLGYCASHGSCCEANVDGSTNRSVVSTFLGSNILAHSWPCVEP